MKNKTLILFFLPFFSCILCFSQTKQIEGVVNYTQINSKYEFKSKLYFTPNRSIYKYNVTGFGSKKRFKSTDPNELDFDTSNDDEFGEVTFIDYSKKQVIVREKVIKRAFIYEEFLPQIKWKLVNETKQISKFNCQKATTTFRGRNYIAWFTTEIPISMGPWKFNGLPGLILELYDDTLQIQISFNSISIPENVDKYMNFPLKEGVRITFEEHKNIFTTTFDKIMAMMDIPKGTSVKFDVDKSGFFELSYEK
jgi:GLPGLI family protein